MRISSFDITHPTAAQKGAWVRQQRTELADKAQAVKVAAQQLPKEQLNAWDRASIDRAAQLAAEAELEELRKQIARIYELSGEHYALSRAQFWRQFHQRRGLK